MRSFRVLQQSARLVNSGPPVPADIITLPWTQYHEQGRSAVTDYDPANAEPTDPDPWVGIATAGPSAGRDLVAFGAPWGLPDVGSSIDGTSTLRFNDDLDDLKSQLTALNYFTLSAFTIGLLVKLDPTVGNLPAGASGQALMGATYANVLGGKTGGVGQCKLHIANAIDNYALSPTFALGTWVTVFARFGGGQMDVRVNKVTGTSVSSANVGAGWNTFYPRAANASNGSSIHDRLAFGYADTRLSDADCDLAHAWWKYRFPSAGLP